MTAISQHNKVYLAHSFSSTTPESTEQTTTSSNSCERRKKSLSTFLPSNSFAYGLYFALFWAPLTFWSEVTFICGIFWAPKTLYWNSQLSGSCKKKPPVPWSMQGKVITSIKTHSPLCSITQREELRSDQPVQYLSNKSQRQNLVQPHARQAELIATYFLNKFDSVGIFKTAQQKLILTWGWAHVLSIAPIVQILNRWAWPKLFSLSQVYVYLGWRPMNERTLALLLSDTLINSNQHLCCDTNTIMRR
jgi:hypothetical protein